jgi:tryptophan synthase beta subunit
MFHHASKSRFAHCFDCNALSPIHSFIKPHRRVRSVAAMDEQIVDGFHALPTKGTKPTVGPSTLL